MATERRHAVLVYNGACSSCSRFARAVHALDANHAIEMRTLQDADIRSKLEPKLQAAYWESFHLVDADSGAVESGADALPRLGRLLPAVRPFAAGVFATPGLRHLPAACYGWLSRATTCRLIHPHA